MDIFKENKIIFQGGGMKSAFRWSLVAFLTISAFDLLNTLLFIKNKNKKIC